MDVIGPWTWDIYCTVVVSQTGTLAFQAVSFSSTFTLSIETPLGRSSLRKTDAGQILVGSWNNLASFIFSDGSLLLAHDGATVNVGFDRVVVYIILARTWVISLTIVEHERRVSIFERSMSGIIIGIVSF